VQPAPMELEPAGFACPSCTSWFNGEHRLAYRVLPYAALLESKDIGK